FRLDRPAQVRMDAVRTDTIREGRPSEESVWSTTASFGRGVHRLAWRPAAATPPRTYILRLTVTDGAGRRRVYGDERPWRKRISAPVVRVQGIDLGFTRRSYAPGEQAAVTVGSDARSLKLQVFAYGNQSHPTQRDLRTSGAAMTPPLQIAWSAHRDRPALVRFVRAGDWASGLYFLRATAGDGRVGYAPLIVRPKRLGTTRVAVVLATSTWQAYNFDDANGDGWGDSWYVSSAQRSVDLSRPFLDFGVPFRFKDWDLTFVSWLNRTAKSVDYLSDDDLERVATGDELARAYDLIVFPGHEEYVTRHMYDVVARYRDLGGNLAFLAANNFYWRVDRKGDRLTRVKQWRDLGRPEAALVGAQYVGSNHGATQAGYTVAGADVDPWVFAGTNLVNGDPFGRYGIEIDGTTVDSPWGTRVLARIPNLMGPGRSAEMTYYETPAGAKVFDAGAINFAASLDEPRIARLLQNVWEKLAVP
ncbi:MAG: hypothetical protein QOE36_293, partial [Gaiellaceae bacterium]|nr:hypothetical protein [Gaiellaceae bacterium]